MSDYIKTTWIAGTAPGISAANLNKIEDGVDTAHSELDTHANNTTTMHDATSAATASKLIIRDASGRAKVVAPSAEDDIALKSNVTTAQSNLDTHTALTTTAHGGLTPSSHVGTGGAEHANVVAAGAAGFMAGADKTKLDGIETGATADQTAAEILSAIITVDGSGSTLDADLLDGSHKADITKLSAMAVLKIVGSVAVSADNIVSVTIQSGASEHRFYTYSVYIPTSSIALGSEVSATETVRAVVHSWITCEPSYSDYIYIVNGTSLDKTVYYKVYQLIE